MPRQFTVEKACRIISVLNGDKFSLVNFYSEHIGAFPDLKAELIALDRVFTNDFGGIEYRNLLNMVILACAIRLSAVMMRTRPVQHKSMSNWNAERGHLHHDADLTPLVTGQFLQAKEDEFLFNKDYYDLVVGDIAVEVGDCRVSKVLEALRRGMNLWVFPKPISTIYVFHSGENWCSFERLENCMLRNALEKTSW